MKKVLGNILGALSVIGMLMLMGSVFAIAIGPEQLTALYERARPILPFFLAGLGLLIVAGVAGSFFWQSSQSDEQLRARLAEWLGALKGATPEDIEKTLAMLTAADRDKLNAALSLVRQLALQQVRADVILVTVRSLCVSSGRAGGGPTASEGRSEATPPAATR
jgi:hypothetical protein